jgi:hypothetical protein
MFRSFKALTGNTMLTGPGLKGAIRVKVNVLELDNAELKVAKGPEPWSKNELGGKRRDELEFRQLEKCKKGTCGFASILILNEVAAIGIQSCPIPS